MIPRDQIDHDLFQQDWTSTKPGDFGWLVVNGHHVGLVIIQQISVISGQAFNSSTWDHAFFSFMLGLLTF